MSNPATREAPVPDLCFGDCCAEGADELGRLATRSSLRLVLYVVLAINALMFVVELVAGIVSGSAALIADSVDMFGDAAVYLLSLFALDRSLHWRAGAALVKAGFVFLFGAWLLFEIGRRVAEGGAPAAEAIGVVGLLALLANLACLGLLWRFRAHDINMSSTFACSRNDVAANLGVLAAAAGVWVTGAAWPDLVVGLLIAVVFLRSAWSITRSAFPLFVAGSRN